ncbi:DUF397 domain-containing protein [Streptomyces sp. NPDC004609]|uniref:DUF397 domain-containing protein n=1 Tax=Streptomyces sp. NPDC004609 TaxID=3364704 RepID=UPI00369FE1E1
MSTEPNFPGTEWITSTYSGNGGGNCVEWAPDYARTHGVVPVRDSKMATGPTLTLSPQVWAGLIAYARTATRG